MAVVKQPEGNQLLLVPVEGHREWSTGVCDCFSDCGTCIMTYFCLSCMAARIATRIGDYPLMPCCVMGGITAMRARIRTMGGIRGSICMDSLTTSCCMPCVICQMSRELDNMGV